MNRTGRTRLRCIAVVGAFALGLLGMQDAKAQGPATVFVDDFNRSTGLGTAWRVPSGAFTTNGVAARGTRPVSYAFWAGTVPLEATATCRIGPTLGSTYVGVTARATAAAPDRDHYAAYVDPTGVIALSRREAWAYRLLASGPRFPAGAHTLGLSVSGTNPVVLSVLLDGVQVLRYSDASAGALRHGAVGLFDYNGAAVPVDQFVVTGAAPPVFNESVAWSTLQIAGQKLLRAAAVTSPTQYPKSTLPNGSWSSVPNTDMTGWTQGFFPGSLWYLFRSTGDPAYRRAADLWTRNLELQKTNRQTHDLGPKLFYSFGNAYWFTGDTYYRDVVLQGAESLASRFRPQVGVLSCCDWNPRWKLPLVVDTMISLEMLMWAAEHGGRPELKDMAIRHALVSAQELVRPDGGTFHIVDYDPATGAVRFKETFQGYADSSTWARGQAWAIYGFTLMYRYTHDQRMLAAARKVTEYYVSRLPADMVPNWDFDAPRQSKDSSAAAIAASALLELSDLETDAANRLRYRDIAVKTLASLASPAYLSAADSHLGVLLHGVGHLPANQEIDVSLIYGDYFFIEALTRYIASERRLPRLTLVSPNGGESLAGGSNQLIRWIPSGDIPDVRLELSLNVGGNWETVTPSTPNTGQYQWNVPQLNAQQALIRISDARNRFYGDMSDETFRIFVSAPIVFSDDFNRTGALGTSWRVERGAFRANGSAATGTLPQSYAFWTGGAPSEGMASVTLSTPIRSTYVGVTVRSGSAIPDREHYAAYVSPDGRIRLARRNEWVYTALAEGPVFPAGTHRLSLRASSVGPVTLTVLLDGVQILRVVDNSANRLGLEGPMGMFDYNGSGQPIDRFEVLP